MNQMIVRVESVSSKDDAKKLMDKKVVWKTQSGKEMEGTITNIHGNNGAVRVQFSKGLPGQAVGKKVLIK